LQFDPNDLAIGLNAAGKGAEAAIDAGDDVVLAPDHIGEAQDAVGGDFRMLHRVPCRIDDARTIPPLIKTAFNASTSPAKSDDTS
jgi:hypothetical protein